MRINHLFFLLPFLFQTTIFAYSPFKNFNGTVKVNDIEISGGVIWTASGGGLAGVKKGGAVFLAATNENFSDVKLTALVSDESGGLWIGTEYGTLYFYKNGKLETFNNYRSAQWDIRSLSLHDSYLLISSSKGMSIFDIHQKKAIVNAASFQGFGPAVNDALIRDDTLYVGLSNAYARVSLDKPLRDINFFDETIWTVRPRAEGVKRLLVRNGKVQEFSHLTVMHKDTKYHADSTTLYKNGNQLISLPSEITALKVDSEGTLWCGTSDNYFYAVSGENAFQYEIPGMFFGNVSRVAVGPNGKTWFIPRVEVQNTPWWQGVVSYDGSHWRLFNATTVEGFGDMGDGSEFMGISRDAHGNMWFGTNGRGLRKYDMENNQWSRYFPGVLSVSTFQKYEPGVLWSKSDAVALDSSGFLWAAAYNTEDGALVCYNSAADNPQAGDYWRVSEATDMQFVSINVDQSGRIFAGSTNGQLIIVVHDGTPLDKQGVIVERERINGHIFDMTSTADGFTWIATDQGLYRWGEDAGLEKIKNSPADIRTIEQENNSVLWLGSDQNGLTKWERPAIYSSTYEGEMKNYTTSDGLINNSVSWIDIDRDEGVLWIATADGVSAFDLGYAPVKGFSSNEEMQVYPNPFRKEYDTEVVFRNVSSQSVINIYSIKGQLVATLRKEGDAVTWKVPGDIIPGTYVAVEKGAVKAHPQKLLIRPY